MMNCLFYEESIICALTSDPDNDGKGEVVILQFDLALRYETFIIDGSTLEESVFLPSVGINSQGDLGITFSASSDTQCPAMFYSIACNISNGIAFEAPVEIIRSSFGINISRDSSNGNRWGDYSCTVRDPEDDSLWFANEYVNLFI